ncbi:MAG: prepilin-type N-terminal cleavage/methylation domain-containing protein [Candidatus Omnitrophica bacterium]|nr:prepilin-type N-terminal cleavage/methylation domain-containing protein [Candidatus Omnitrophota bacterium]
MTTSNRYRVQSAVPGTEFGLTLVEMLISMALVAVVGLTVFGVFSGGMNIWERVQGTGSRDRLVELTLEQVRRDLCGARFFEPVGFEGAYDEISFPSLVTMTYKRGKQEFEVEEPGRVGYWFNSIQGTLARSEHGYRLTRRYRLRDSRRPVLLGVRRVRFSYAKLKSDGKEVEWSGRWEPADGHPAAVKIEIGYLDETTQQERNRSLLVLLPLSPRGPK